MIEAADRAGEGDGGIGSTVSVSSSKGIGEYEGSKKEKEGGEEGP